MKRALIKILLLLTIAGLMFISVPFISSLGYSEDSLNKSLVSISVPNLVEGVPAIIKIDTAELIFLKPSKDQLNNIKELNTKVWNSSTNTFNSELGAYVYWAVSTRFGCTLRHIPPQKSRIIDYDENAVWLGGYWDDTCEVSYDYAGRAIKTYNYTYNGFNQELSNLHSPTLFEKQRDHYNVSIYQR